MPAVSNHLNYECAQYGGSRSELLPHDTPFAELDDYLTQRGGAERVVYVDSEPTIGGLSPSAIDAERLREELEELIRHHSAAAGPGATRMPWVPLPCTSACGSPG